MRINHNYSKLWQLYAQSQASKYQHIDPVAIFNSRLQDRFMHIELNGADITGTYSSKGSTITIPAQEITDAITDAVNFGNVRYLGGVPVGGFERFDAFVAALPHVRVERAIELKAVNNHVVLEDGMYYKFIDDSGKTKLLACTGSSLCELETDKLAGKSGGENEERAGFWRIPLNTCGTPENLQRKFVEEIGIQPGFFTVEAEGKKSEYYYSIEDGIIAKWQYDSEWDALSSGLALSGDWCEPGDIINANGKQFIVSEDRTIDVKYGDDIPGLYPMKVIGHVSS